NLPPPTPNTRPDCDPLRAPPDNRFPLVPSKRRPKRSEARLAYSRFSLTHRPVLRSTASKSGSPEFRRLLQIPAAPPDTARPILFPFRPTEIPGREIEMQSCSWNISY